VALLSELMQGSVADWVVLLSPSDVLDGTNAVLFDARPESGAVDRANLDPVAFLGAAAIGVATAVGLTIRRYLRIAA
jgi:hypothetical protein